MHDYLNQRGGAERVALELARMWPQAPLYTSLYDADRCFAEFERHDVRSSALRRLRIGAGFRALLPLYPLAFRSFGALEQDVVISSSSGWAHGVRTSSRTLHVVYCHTPARWLYQEERYLSDPRLRRALRPLTGALRRWDRSAARRADVYVANAANTRDRIRSAYGIDSVVVHPPVDVARFHPAPRGERLLVISRLLPYKRVDLVVGAARASGLGLDVVGAGPQLDALRELAGPETVFHGSVDDRAVVELLEDCRCVCVAAAEDFGIVAVEAAAAGKPVVAFAEGGALETVEDGVTGALFREPTVQALLSAIRRADALEAGPEDLATSVRRFAPERFRERLLGVIRGALARTAPPRGLARSGSEQPEPATSRESSPLGRGRIR